MIDFEKIPNSLPQEIATTRRSGVVLGWMLSKIFDFKFDLSDFYKTIDFNPKTGNINGNSICLYANSKELYYYDFPQGTSVDIDFSTLINTGIAVGMTYSSYNNNNSAHMSLLTNMTIPEFSMIYGNPNYYDIRLVQGLYLFFITRLPDISEHITINTTHNTLLTRYPNYGTEF